LDIRGRKWQEAGKDCIMRANIVRVIKSGRMRWWAGHEGDAFNILIEKPGRNRPLGKHKRGWRIVLEWNLDSSGSG
jgi:hypothetical protein